MLLRVLYAALCTLYWGQIMVQPFPIILLSTLLLSPNTLFWCLSSPNTCPFTHVVLCYCIRIVENHKLRDQGLSVCGLQRSWHRLQWLRLRSIRRVLCRHALHLFVQDYYSRRQLGLKSARQADFQREPSSRSVARCEVHGRGCTGK